METPHTVSAEPEGAGRLPYEAPRASFVPLKVEERLMACTKVIPTPSCNLNPFSS